MPPTASNKNRTTNNTDKDSENPHTNTATRYSTRRTGAPPPQEDFQEFKDALEGRKFLEHHLLLCPPYEPASHQSLAACLHQISALPGMGKTGVSAVRAVALLLDEMEETQIHTAVKEAVDIQINEATIDTQKLIEDASHKVGDLIKQIEDKIALIPPAPQATQISPPTHTYASALINPPPHANPKLAAREGIKARQFALIGLKDSALSHLNPSQLKTLTNKIISDLGHPTGKIHSITNTRMNGIILEADCDATAKWLSSEENQKKICEKMDPNIKFYARNYKVIAYNVPIDMDPKNQSHLQEICETNNFDTDTSPIIEANWAKAIENRTTNQRTAHLYLTFNNIESANRAITYGLFICNKKCRIEKNRCEPLRCLKCQGWNHLAKDCHETHDTCGNCTGQHRTRDCKSNVIRCASCKTDGHQSWSRNCPTFTKKLTELNSRNLENSTLYFPSTEPWTWTTKPAHTLPTHNPSKVLDQQQQTSNNPRPRHPSPDAHHNSNPSRQRHNPKNTDTYFPFYSTAISWDDPQPNNTNNINTSHFQQRNATPGPSTVPSAQTANPSSLNTLNE